MARVAGISATSVHRLWAANDLKPHLTRTFKLSNDPHFEEKFWDVIGLYLDPPDKTLVHCCDEKKARLKPWSVRNLVCLWGSDISVRNRMTISATARSPCSLRWIIFKDA